MTMYITKDYLNIFFINLKCCRSTFESLVELNKINILKNGGKFDMDKYNKIEKNAKIWMIVRCPYERFCSFYVDKFKNCFETDYHERKIFQPFKKNIYDYHDQSKIEQLEFSIKDLINVIKKGYVDDHLKSQCDIIKQNIFNKDINILRMDDPKFNKICESILGFDMIKRNVTNGGKKKDILLDDKDREFLQEKYKKDFELYSKNIIKF